MTSLPRAFVVERTVGIGMVSLALSTCGSDSMSWKDAYGPLLAKLGIATEPSAPPALGRSGDSDTEANADAAVDARPTPGTTASDAFSHDRRLSDHDDGEATCRRAGEEEEEENDDNMDESGPLLRS